jgi:group II intron reverse transcriptase/maturase
MRDATTVLGIIQERGKRGLPLEDIYRQLFNPDLYLRAYTRLYANKGAMTPGSTPETVDGMSLAKIAALIDDLRHERYRWTPVRRTYIPKKNGKLRPLGLPTWTDKLLQEVIRTILEAYYEPQFSVHSHGFRPNHGCHTALSEVAKVWTGTKWFIEGDISQCFDRLDHQVLLSILAEKLHDNRFLRLIQSLLQAGYLEEWQYHKTLSGCPQGGVVSPILSNIYLDRLDKYVEQVLLPAHNHGKARRNNAEYMRIYNQRRVSKKNGDRATAKAVLKELHRMPRNDPNDPGYRRLHYIRYADDFLLGFVGPRHEAEEIKRQLGDYLRDTLNLELSQEKTLITHATQQAACFLGYEIVTQMADDHCDRKKRRMANGKIGLRVPMAVVEKKRALYLRHGKPKQRPELRHDSDFTIVERYQAEYRGIVQYYLLAQNVSWLWKLHWTMNRSLLHTLAGKHKTTCGKMLRKYKTVVDTPHGTLKCLKVWLSERGRNLW